MLRSAGMPGSTDADRSQHGVDLNPRAAGSTDYLALIKRQGRENRAKIREITGG